MYQKIIELLRIHGYLSQDTEKGPCYVKSTKKRNKCVYVMFDKNPDGSAILEEDLYQMEDCAKQNFGADCAIYCWCYQKKMILCLLIRMTSLKICLDH